MAFRAMGNKKSIDREGGGVPPAPGVDDQQEQSLQMEARWDGRGRGLSRVCE